MNVWQEIDALQARHDREHKETACALVPLRAIDGSLGFDDYGRWVCRYIPKGGGRRQERTGARRGAQGHSRRGGAP